MKGNLFNSPMLRIQDPGGGPCLKPSFLPRASRRAKRSTPSVYMFV